MSLLTVELFESLRFNRDNITLVNLRKENIEEITSVGLKTKNKIYEVDSIIFATGFDAMTGALHRIDIRGRSNYVLRDKWGEGPRTYLGIMTVDFPNLFMITGPGSPSVLGSMIVHYDGFEPTIEAEDAWVNRVNEVANDTLYPTTNSWYIGANIPGKPRVFMPYVGGVPAYRQKCKDVVDNDYEGFQCIKHQSMSSVATS